MDFIRSGNQRTLISCYAFQRDIVPYILVTVCDAEQNGKTGRNPPTMSSAAVSDEKSETKVKTLECLSVMVP